MHAKTASTVETKMYAVKTAREKLRSIVSFALLAIITVPTLF
jgi:hypothetical protein